VVANKPIDDRGYESYSPHSAWKSRSANFVMTEISEDEMRRPTLNAVPYGLQELTGSKTPRKEDRPTMDGSSEQPQMTAGLDLGDKYSYLCLIDQQSGEVMEEGRLRTSPEAFRRRFASEQPPMRIAIEAGTHSPWASRVLEGCGHEVLVANSRKTRLIYANKRKTDEIDALRTWLAWLEWIRSYSIHSSTGAKTLRPIWP
jgi:Transposase